jgi:hypothetical protein
MSQSLCIVEPATSDFGCTLYAQVALILALKHFLQSDGSSDITAIDVHSTESSWVHTCTPRPYSLCWYGFDAIASVLLFKNITTWRCGVL